MLFSEGGVACRIFIPSKNQRTARTMVASGGDVVVMRAWYLWMNKAVRVGEISFTNSVPFQPVLVFLDMYQKF